MKRKFLLCMVFCFMILILFSSCEMIEKVEEISIKTKNGNEVCEYEIGEFDYLNYSVLVTYSSNKTEELALTEDLLSNYSVVELMKVGRHTIEVNLEKKSTTFDVIIKNKSITQENQVAPYLPNIDITYDGKPHEISVLGDIPDGVSVYYPQATSFVDAGEYSVFAILYGENYETITLSTTVKIRKATYDLSGVSLTVDYGTDENGTSLDHFTYDGLNHSATLKGDIPSGLKYEYYIGTSQDIKSAQKGNSAKDAGIYYVFAVFTGDSKNYETSNLTLVTQMKIENDLT